MRSTSLISTWSGKLIPSKIIRVWIGWRSIFFIRSSSFLNQYQIYSPQNGKLLQKIRFFALIISFYSFGNDNRKKLDPLEAYIPAVLLSRAQFEDLGNVCKSSVANSLNVILFCGYSCVGWIKMQDSSPCDYLTFRDNSNVFRQYFLFKQNFGYFFCVVGKWIAKLYLVCIFSYSSIIWTEKSLDTKQPNYDMSRFMLRSGPAGSLRLNIRAVSGCNIFTLVTDNFIVLINSATVFKTGGHVK